MPFAKRSGSNPIYATPAHRAARAALIEAYQPGDPCCLCGHPMWPLPGGKTSNIHADHNPVTGGYRGLAHGSKCQVCGKRCNQVDGAKRGRARQDDRSTNLRWLQVDNHPCPMCGATVTWATSRCCSRACANELRKATRKPKPSAVYVCPVCAHDFAGRKRKYCSERCRLLAVREMSRAAYRMRVGIPLDAPLAAVGRPRSVS